jgi:hypothetical protein
VWFCKGCRRAIARGRYDFLKGLKRSGFSEAEKSQIIAAAAALRTLRQEFDRTNKQGAPDGRSESDQAIHAE